MTDDDDRSIEELCKPLSAKVMPRSAMYNIGGTKIDAGRALASQRSAVFQTTKSTRKKKGVQSPARLNKEKE